MQKLCCIYDTAPRYREPIYTVIDKEYDCDWYLGDVSTNIKEMDLNLLKSVTRFHTVGYHCKAYWQCDIIRLLFSRKYNIYFVGAETRAISKWLFLF